MNTVDNLIEDAIKKVQTNAHICKDIAGDLRSKGFDGETVGELRRVAETLLKCVHEYQAYNNARDL